MGITIDAHVRTKVNYAACRFEKDLVTGLEVKGRPGERIPVRISAEPGFIEEKELIYVMEGTAEKPEIRPDGRYFRQHIIEERQGQINIEVLDPYDTSTVLEKRQFPVTLQPYLHWDRMDNHSGTLAMFVTPGTRRVKELVQKAARPDPGAGSGFDLDPAQITRLVYSGNDSNKGPSYARLITENIYTKLSREGLTYINPPAIFDYGQKIRIPEYVLSERSRQGTCLDLAVLMAACLESAGLYSCVVLIPGHAFAAVWLKNPGDWVQADNKGRDAEWRIKKACDDEMLLPVECTTYTGNYPAPFTIAVKYGKSNLREVSEMIDMKKARERGMVPAFEDLDEISYVLDSFFLEPEAAREAGRVEIDAEVSSVINFARDVKGDRIIRMMKVSGTAGRSVGIRIHSESGLIYEREPDFFPEMDGVWFRPHVLLNADTYRQKIGEKTDETLIIDVFEKGTRNILLSKTYKVTVMPYMYWDAVDSREMLAAFVQPNAPMVAEIMKEATQICNSRGVGMAGYQSGDRKSVKEQARAIYQVLQKKNFLFERPQKNFEEEGHLIRIPEYLLGMSMPRANVLDLAVLFASCLEAAGLYSAILVHNQTVLIGLWMREQETLPDFLMEDGAGMFYHTAITSEQVMALDCSCLTLDKTEDSFDRACSDGREKSEKTRYAVDIESCRDIGIKPAFTFSEHPICVLAKDSIKGKNEVVEDDLGDELLDDSDDDTKEAVPFKLCYIVFCIFHENDVQLENRFINSNLQWLQNHYRADKTRRVMEAFVYNMEGRTCATDFMPIEDRENFYIDIDILKKELDRKEKHPLPKLYYLAMSMLEDQWKKNRNCKEAEYKLIIIENTEILSRDMNRILLAQRKWKMPYNVVLIHPEKRVPEGIHGNSMRLRNWKFTKMEELEKGDIYGTEFDD